MQCKLAVLTSAVVGCLCGWQGHVTSMGRAARHEPRPCSCAVTAVGPAAQRSRGWRHGSGGIWSGKQGPFLAASSGAAGTPAPPGSSTPRRWCQVRHCPPSPPAHRACQNGAVCMCGDLVSHSSMPCMHAHAHAPLRAHATQLAAATHGEVQGPNRSWHVVQVWTTSLVPATQALRSATWTCWPGWPWRHAAWPPSHKPPMALRCERAGWPNLYCSSVNDAQVWTISKQPAEASYGSRLVC